MRSRPRLPVAVLLLVSSGAMLLLLFVPDKVNEALNKARAQVVSGAGGVK